MSKSIDEVFDAVLDTKSAVVDLKLEFVRLEGHVNDELEKMNEKIATKVDPDELLSHFGRVLLNHRIVKWVATASATALLALVVQQNFGGPLLHGAEFLVRLAHFV